MKRPRSIYHTVVALALVLAAAARGDEPIRHRFLALDFMRGALFHVDQVQPEQSWSMPWGGDVRDLQLIGKQQLLVTRPDGFSVYDLSKRSLVAETTSPLLKGVITARRLDGGRTLLGANVPRGKTSVATIYELDAGGQIERQIEFPALRKLRMMRGTRQNTLLLCDWDGVSEVSIEPGLRDDQRLVRQFVLPRPRNAYMGLRKPDGNTLVSGGYAQGLFEYRADGTLLREIVVKQPAGLYNNFYAGLQILPNGHIVFANWNGHSEKDFVPGWRLIELDQEGQVVWYWDGLEENAGSINGLIVLDHLDLSLPHDDAGGVLEKCLFSEDKP